MAELLDRDRQGRSRTDLKRRIGWRTTSPTLPLRYPRIVTMTEDRQAMESLFRKNGRSFLRSFAKIEALERLLPRPLRM